MRQSRRTIKTIKEFPEISLVTFPMNDLERNTAVKASDIRTVREFEDFLREIAMVAYLLKYASSDYGTVAGYAYEMADAMIAERLKHPTEKS